MTFKANERGFQLVNGFMLTIGWMIGAIIYSALKSQAVGVSLDKARSVDIRFDAPSLSVHFKTVNDENLDIGIDQRVDMHLIEEARDLADKVVMMKSEMGMSP